MRHCRKSKIRFSVAQNNPAPRSRTSIFRNQQLERIPQRAMFSAKIEKEKPQSNIPVPKMPESKGPWWSPENAYWLVDDLVYKGIEKIYNAVNWIAKKAGKGDGLSKVSVGAGAFLLGNTIMIGYKTIQNPQSSVINLVALGFFGAISVMLVRTSKEIESLDGAIADSGKDTLARAVRLPMLAMLLGYDLAKWSVFDNAEVLVKDMPCHLGCIIMLYLLSGENGMLNRAKDAVKDVMEDVRAAFEQKEPIEVKGK